MKRPLYRYIGRYIGPGTMLRSGQISIRELKEGALFIPLTRREAKSLSGTDFSGRTAKQFMALLQPGIVFSFFEKRIEKMEESIRVPKNLKRL